MYFAALFSLIFLAVLALASFPLLPSIVTSSSFERVPDEVIRLIFGCLFALVERSVVLSTRSKIMLVCGVWRLLVSDMLSNREEFEAFADIAQKLISDDAVYIEEEVLKLIVSYKPPMKISSPAEIESRPDLLTRLLCEGCRLKFAEASKQESFTILCRTMCPVLSSKLSRFFKNSKLIVHLDEFNIPSDKIMVNFIRPYIRRLVDVLIKAVVKTPNDAKATGYLIGKAAASMEIGKNNDVILTEYLCAAVDSVYRLAKFLGDNEIWTRFVQTVIMSSGLKMLIFMLPLDQEILQSIVELYGYTQ